MRWKLNEVEKGRPSIDLYWSYLSWNIFLEGELKKNWIREIHIRQKIQLKTINNWIKVSGRKGTLDCKLRLSQKLYTFLKRWKVSGMTSEEKWERKPFKKRMDLDVFLWRHTWHFPALPSFFYFFLETFIESWFVGTN